MTFTVQTYSDMVRLLRQHPEWRQELYTMLAPEAERGMAALLMEGQRRSDARMERVEVALARLAEAQQRTEEKVEALAEAQRGFEDRLARVEAALDRLEKIVEKLVDQVSRNTGAIGDIRGRLLEQDYREKAVAYFGPLLRRIKLPARDVIADQLEGQISQGELRDALLIDVLVRGYPRDHPELAEVLLAVEVSSVIDRDDVSRARRRAALLSKSGLVAIPAVAGQQISLGGEDEVRFHKVVLMQDGRIEHWEAALSRLAPPAGQSE